MHGTVIREPAAGEGLMCFDERDLPAGDVDVRAAFGCVEPVCLEIGFGKGRTLREWPAACPGMLLGIEKRRSFVSRALARLGPGAHEKLRVVRADFRSLAPRLRPGGFFAGCALHFPDPWWKRRHRKRQVVAGPVIAQLARLLRPGARVFVQTDVRERAEQFRAGFLASGLFKDMSGPAGYLPSNPTGVRSNREVRCEAQGVPIYRLLFELTGGSAGCTGRA